jgi:hypothetical protein
VFDLVARGVGDREHLVEHDLRFHALALYDAVKPRPAVERLRAPIDTSRPPGHSCLLMSPFMSRKPGAML